MKVRQPSQKQATLLVSFTRPDISKPIQVYSKYQFRWPSTVRKAGTSWKHPNRWRSWRKVNGLSIHHPPISMGFSVQATCIRNGGAAGGIRRAALHRHRRQVAEGPRQARWGHIGRNLGLWLLWWKTSHMAYKKKGSMVKNDDKWWKMVKNGEKWWNDGEK